MPNAGEYRHLIDIESPTEGAPGAYGATTNTWSVLVRDMPARIVLDGGREVYRAQQVYAEATGVIEIRYRDDITSRMRARWGSRYFHLLGPVGEDVKRTELMLACAEDL